MIKCKYRKAEVNKAAFVSGFKRHIRRLKHGGSEQYVNQCIQILGGTQWGVKY